VKWKIDDNVRIFGYQQPDYQTRLTVIRLNEDSVPVPCNDHPDFLIEAPTTRGMGTATGGKEMVIETEPGQDHLIIHTDDFSYNIKKSWGTRDLHIEKHYLPMDKIKITGSILKDRLQKYVQLAPSGPLRLIISNDVVKFVSKTDIEKASLDITDHVTIHSNNSSNEYLYDIHLLSEILKKLPMNKEIELFVNDDLIRLRYEIGDNLGHINYYQQGQADTSQTSRY